jgi:hypothetical protein
VDPDREPAYRVLPGTTGIAQLGTFVASGEKLIIFAAGLSGSICRMGNRCQCSGSSCCPFLIKSKCRWHPVEEPVVPTFAMI